MTAILISDEELEIFEKQEVNEELVNKIKSKNKEIMQTIITDKIIKDISNNLDKDDKIEFYFTAMDYEVSLTRGSLAYISYMGVVANGDNWGAKVTSIFTRKKLVLVKRNLMDVIVETEFIDYKDIDCCKVNNREKLLIIEYQDKKLALMITEDARTFVSLISNKIQVKEVDEKYKSQGSNIYTVVHRIIYGIVFLLGIGAIITFIAYLIYLSK